MRDFYIYNSLSGEIEKFKAIEDGKVSLYVCGPTVYNDIHIGNARPIIVFDVFFRMLTRIGYEVTYMANITDIDDKIIKTALKENISESEVSKRYLDAYLKIRQELNALPPTIVPKVTENMNEIITFIEKLEKIGFAYESNGDVFFRVTKSKKYGMLGNFNVEDLKIGARIEENDKKENPLDFALWKKTETGLKWSSRWCEGRPGWHTECVVMINKYFPRGLIDIHGGGFDLKFPHHENEIAQSMAVNNTTLANYWMHNGLINIDNVKMSKSIGNFRLAKTMIEQYGGNVVRWVLLSAHYRTPVNFTDEIMENAVNEVSKIFDTLKNTSIKLQLHNISSKQVKDEYIEKFITALCDDLNTSNAQTVIFEVVKQTNLLLRSKNFEELCSFFNTLCELLDLFGLKYDIITLSSEDRQLFNKWEEARANKDFASSDFYRQQLMDKNLL